MSQRKEGAVLTDKEKFFCEEYILDMDATKAAIRAGYSEESAKSTGYQVKQRPEVNAYINTLIENRSLRLRITADDVLLELAKIAFAKGPGPQPPEEGLIQDSPEEVYVEDGTKRDAATVYRVEETDEVTGRRTTRYFSLSAKIAALKLLGRHLGLFGATGKQAPPAPNIIFPRMEYVPNRSNSAA